MKEIWKDIEGYEGHYQISNLGRIKSLKRLGNDGRRLPEKILKTGNSHGYRSIVLRKDGKSCIYSVHRLVGKAFIPNPENKPCINHKDENRANNNVENLEWCTYKYNDNYGTRNARAGLGHAKRVIQYDLNGNEIRRWDSAAEASRFYGAVRTAVVAACGKIQATSCGYKWRYESEVEA